MNLWTNFQVPWQILLSTCRLILGSIDIFVAPKVSIHEHGTYFNLYSSFYVFNESCTFLNKGLTHFVRFTSSKLFGRYCNLYLHFCLLLVSGNTINIPKLKLDLPTSLRICLLFLIVSVFCVFFCNPHSSCPLLKPVGHWLGQQHSVEQWQS